MPEEILQERQPASFPSIWWYDCAYIDIFPWVSSGLARNFKTINYLIKCHSVIGKDSCTKWPVGSLLKKTLKRADFWPSIETPVRMAVSHVRAHRFSPQLQFMASCWCRSWEPLARALVLHSYHTHSCLSFWLLALVPLTIVRIWRANWQMGKL